MGNPSSVLVIDDELDWRLDIQSSLTIEGLKVDTAAELTEAEAQLERSIYDLVLVDRKFGQDSDRGLRIIESLKQRYPDLEVILLTNYLDEGSAICVMMNDAFTAISKGDPDSLLRAVQSVILKKTLQLGPLRRAIINAFLNNPSLTRIRDDLSSSDVPRARFLEIVALAHLVDATGPANAETVRKIAENSHLAMQLPCLATHDEASRLTDDALTTLAELAPHFLATVTSEEAQAVFHSPVAIFVERREPLGRVLIERLSQTRTVSSDQDRLSVLQSMLEADLGAAPFVLEMALACVLSRASDPLLRSLNVESLIQLRGQQLLGRLGEIATFATKHTYAYAMARPIEVLRLLLDLQVSYDYLTEIRDYPLEHRDWLETFSGHIIPLMAQARLLQRHQSMFPEVEETVENCRILLNRFNEKFIEFIWDDRRGYTAWVRSQRRDRPLMTSDVVREVVLPALERHRTVYLIIFDGMSLLSWDRIKQRYLGTLFNFDRDQQAMAVVPTAARYARPAIFAGKLPREFIAEFVEQNPNERRLLNTALKEHESGLSVPERDFMKYAEVRDGGEFERIKRNLKDLIASHGRLKVIIFDPHDKVTRVAPGYAEDFAELFYARSIHPIMEELSQLSDTSFVITSDHGFCEIRELKTVRDMFASRPTRESDSLDDPSAQLRRAHFGKRYIDLGTRRFNEPSDASWLRFIPDPARWGLPDSSGYVISVSDKGFGLDAGRVRMFAHGGVSLEEMVVPVAVLRAKG
jgi:CheY-like chemotaxis protein